MTVSAKEATQVSKELLDPISLKLRNFCGVLSVITMCICSLLYVVALVINIWRNNGTFDFWTLLVGFIGPGFVSWQFMGVKNLLSALNKGGLSDTVSNLVKEKFGAKIEVPATDNDQQRSYQPPAKRYNQKTTECDPVVQNQQPQQQTQTTNVPVRPEEEEQTVTQNSTTRSDSNLPDKLF